MKRLLAYLVASLFILGLAPHAMAGAQQERMKACNAEAKEKALKGDERKKFMSECLSTKKPEEGKAKSTQQEKMAKCNADAKAKSLTGDERKKFMSDCLKG